MEEVVVDKKIGGVIATYTIEKDFRTWNELGLNDFKVDNLIEFLSLLPKGEFEFNNENDEAVVEFDTLDDIDEFLSYSMEITGDPYGKDKEGVISFYVVYNGEDNHETFKSLVEQFNLNDYFEYEIKLKKIPKKELEKKQSYLTEEIRIPEGEDVEMRDGGPTYSPNMLVASIKYVPLKAQNKDFEYWPWNMSKDMEITYYHPNGAIRTKIAVKNGSYYGGNFIEYHDNGKIALIINFPKVKRAGELSSKAKHCVSFSPHMVYAWYKIDFSYNDDVKFYRRGDEYFYLVEDRYDNIFKHPFKKYDREGNLIAEQDSNNNFYEYKSNGDIISKRMENETFVKDDEGRILFLVNKETKNYIYHPKQNEGADILLEDGMLRKYYGHIKVNENDEVDFLIGRYIKIVKNGNDWMSIEHNNERYDIKGSEYIDNLISKCRNEIVDFFNSDIPERVKIDRYGKYKDILNVESHIGKLVNTITHLEKTPVVEEVDREPLDGKQKLYIIGGYRYEYIIYARDKNHMYDLLSVKGFNVKDDTLHNPMGEVVKKITEVEGIYGVTQLKD